MAFRQDQPRLSIDVESSSHHAEKYEMDASEHTPLSPNFPQHSNSTTHINAVPPIPTYPPQPAVVSSPVSFLKLKDSDSGSPKRPGNGRGGSWDFLGNLNKSIDEFDSRNTNHANLQFAEGDLPEGKATKIYAYLLNSSIVTRWIIFILPIMTLLWIPGILSVTSARTATIWHVRLLWWSVWFSVIWGGWWAALAFAMLLPHFLKGSLGVVAVGLRRYIDWLTALHRPVAFVAWSIGVLVSFNPVINDRFTEDDAQKYPSSRSSLTLLGRLIFGLVLSSVILLAEKFFIQWVAYKFHQRSYSDRIAHQKAQVECLVVLYRNSRNIDGLPGSQTPRGGGALITPSKLLKTALKGVRRTAETTTTAFGNMASEIAGTSVLQPNSPAAMVASALQTTNKSRVLARRLYYSFLSEGADRLVLGDISRFFPNREMATFAFEIFDGDENGDATLDEIETAILHIHEERLSLANSMKDVDSATGRLDNIFMTMYALLVLLIFAIMLDAAISSLITGAGTVILGLSWLIGGTAQEVLSSIIFLFIKHPFDIGDNIEVQGVPYTVKEMRLLSTILVDARGCDVQSPNILLNASYIMNKRRSGPMSEAFEFSVHYSTTFEQIEDLRSRMLTFVKVERRDYFPAFDVYVVDIPDQGSMMLKAEIKYKSNWQMGILKSQRRNKWICAFKKALKAVKIYGPNGDPDAPPSTKPIAIVPYGPGDSTPFGFPEPILTSASSAGGTDFQFPKRDASLHYATGVSSGEGELRSRNPRG